MMVVLFGSYFHWTTLTAWLLLLLLLLFCVVIGGGGGGGVVGTTGCHCSLIQSKEFDGL